MRTIVIDGGLMPTREEAHAYLSRRLGLPDYYGNNLDALYDILSSDFAGPARLVVYRREALEQSLGAYSMALLAALLDAARENPHLQVVFDSGGAQDSTRAKQR